MPRISTDNYDTVASWNGSQDLFVVEQPDGTKVATPAMVKQFIEAGDFEATGEVEDGHGNILKDMAKSAYVDNAISGLIKVAYITGTTSANGNMQLTGLSKANTIVLGCQFLNASNVSVVAIPYAYSALAEGNWGVHCIHETASYNIVANQALHGYVYYIEKRAYIS